MNPQPSKNEITLYFHPSPGLNWSSPAALTFTTARNKLWGLRRSIGHVSVRIRSVEGEPIEILTGMTQENPSEGRHEVIFGGFGLGILFHDFVGALETAEKLGPELVHSAASGRLSYLRFETTRAAVDRAVDFLRAYEACGANLHYGLPHRPLYAEGGGCSAFGAGVLEAAGLLREEFQREWTREFRIPRTHIGGPRTHRYVGFWQMFLCMTWAQADEPGEDLFFWDPDLMHAWVQRKISATPSAENSRYRPENYRLARGLVIDARNLPVPSGPHFKGDPSPDLHRHKGNSGNPNRSSTHALGDKPR